MKNRAIYFWMAIMAAFIFLDATYAAEESRMLEMTVSIGRGTGDDPMVVVWLETDTGEFVKTIHMFSRDKEYYKEMLVWNFKSRKRKKDAGVDGITSATINWKRDKTIRIPVEVGDVNLLDGSYVLRIESSQWKGKHYRNFKIPLPKDYPGGVHESPGHVKSVKITLKESRAKDPGVVK